MPEDLDGYCLEYPTEKFADWKFISTNLQVCMVIFPHKYANMVGSPGIMKVYK
jgi:hypothetical protein